MAKTYGDKAAKGLTNVTHPENMAQEIMLHKCQLEQVPVTLLPWSSRAQTGGGDQETVCGGHSTPAKATCKRGNLLSLNPSPSRGQENKTSSSGSQTSESLGLTWGLVKWPIPGLGASPSTSNFGTGAQ